MNLSQLQHFGFRIPTEITEKYFVYRKVTACAALTKLFGNLCDGVPGQV